jgi:ribonucleotide reductase beta subunit family protein with ferritin-like domain
MAAPTHSNMTTFRAAELAGTIPQEPITRADLSRFVLLPVRYPAVWDAFKRAQRCYWTATEGDLSEDRKHWDALSDDERYFLKHVLAFFAAADGIVNENISINFASEITLPEARAFYAMQSLIEVVHAEVYSTFIQTYLSDPAEKDATINALATNRAVRAKADWAMSWMDAERASLAERLVAFACVEGVSFQGSFCAIFWLKQRHIMPGLCFYNELIARDEGMHMQFGAMLYNMLTTRLPDERVHEIVRGAVDAEVDFITDAFPCSLVGINCESMTQFVRASANVLCKYLGVPAAFPGAVNPFEWMKLMDLDGKANFFERDVSDYRDAGQAVPLDLEVADEF